MAKKNLLIIGSGDGGTILANSIDKSMYNVTLIDKSDKHVFQPQYLYIAFQGSKDTMVRDEKSLLKKGVTFVKKEVSRIDLNERKVYTTKGKPHSYDKLVVATGVTSDISMIPGMQEINSKYGDYHTNIAQAQKVWSNLNSFKGGTIVIGQSYPICKCPPSPLEGIFLAEELMHRKGLRKKTKFVFFTPYPRAYPAEGINEVIEPLLKERGIEVMPFFNIDRIDPAKKTIYSIEGDSVKYDLPIIVPPPKGMNIEYNPDSVRNDDRLVYVDKFNLKIKGFDDAFAIGDGAAVPTAKSGVDAHLEAKTVARILEGKDAKFNGRTNCPFDTGYGRGTFVIGSYDEKVIKYPVTHMNLFMKHMMAKIYWESLKGEFDSVFDIYFKETEPSRLEKKYGTGKE